VLVLPLMLFLLAMLVYPLTRLAALALLALGAARDVPVMLVYAAGIGIGYGLTFFAASILLLDYFGRGPYLELFSTVNLISTVGAVASRVRPCSRSSRSWMISMCSRPRKPQR